VIGVVLIYLLRITLLCPRRSRDYCKLFLLLTVEMFSVYKLVSMWNVRSMYCL